MAFLLWLWLCSFKTKKLSDSALGCWLGDEVQASKGHQFQHANWIQIILYIYIYINSNGAFGLTMTFLHTIPPGPVLVPHLLIYNLLDLSNTLASCRGKLQGAACIKWRTAMRVTLFKLDAHARILWIYPVYIINKTGMPTRMKWRSCPATLSKHIKKALLRYQ